MEWLNYFAGIDWVDIGQATLDTLLMLLGSLPLLAVRPASALRRL